MANEPWVPTNDRQHPPFEVGNAVAMRHGAYSERRVGPLAQEFLDRLLADPSTPDYLRSDGSFGHTLLAWSRAEARVYLLDSYIDELGLPKALGGRGWLLEQQRRWETTAANLRARLGMDPESRARIARDLADASRGVPGAAWLALIDGPSLPPGGGHDGS